MGNLFIAIQPGLFMDPNEFKEKVHLLVEKAKHSKTKSGESVRIPGEQTIDTRNTSLKLGEIDIEDNLYHSLQQAAEN